MSEKNRESVAARIKGPLWACVGSLAFLAAVLGLGACGEAPLTRVAAPLPTVAIRHRDAYPLMLSPADVGDLYEIEEMYRLDKGPGWGDQATRLSGYRAVYQSSQALLSRIECQVECYLSVQDAQSAYRARKEQLIRLFEEDEHYESVSQSQEEALGDWNWVFKLQTKDQDTLHYLFLRESVLAEIACTGQRSPTLPDQAVRYARSVDQRIFQR